MLQPADSLRVVPAQQPMEWAQWGLGALALLLGAGGLATGLQARKLAQQGYDAARRAESKASQARSDLEKVKQDATQRHGVVEHAFGEVREQLRSLKAAYAETASQVQAGYDAPVTAPVPAYAASAYAAQSHTAQAYAAQASQASAAERVGEAFRAWCVGGGSLMNRHAQFQNDLHGHAMQAGVAEVYRDAGFMGLTFSQTRPANAVPYWLVMLDHEVFLLPEPTNSGSFKEADDRCFDVRQSTPGSLQRVVPARVAMQGDSSFSITERGLLA